MEQIDNRIGAFYRYSVNANQKAYIKDRTAADLHVDDVFEFVDFTSSAIGQQCLYAKMRENKGCPSFEIDEALAAQCQSDSALALKLEKSLRLLANAYTVVALFAKELPGVSSTRLFWYRVLRFVPAFSLLLMLAFGVQWAIFLLIGSVVANAIIHYSNKTSLLPFEESIPQLKALVKCAQQLTKEPQLAELTSGSMEATNSLRFIEKTSGLFRMERLLQSDLALVAWLVTEFLKIFFLTEPYLFYSTIEQVKVHQKSIIKLYLLVGKLDVVLSVAQLRKHAHTCKPEFTSDTRLSFHNIYHPLIENCTSNSLAIQSKSILITGSNMSGKSTFIRTVGINLLLAQNLKTCFADRFETGRHWCIDSMITVADDMQQQKSLFMQEVSVVKSMLDQSAEGGHVFLLDELFKGTNTIERIAAAKAVLRQLVKHDNIVLVSTHDVELTELLNKEYELYHFCESFIEHQIVFDYRLKGGQLTDFNALKILESCGYAHEIMADAYQTTQQLRSYN